MMQFYVTIIIRYCRNNPKGFYMKRTKRLALLTSLVLTLLFLASCKKDYDLTRPPVTSDPPLPLTNHIINPDSEIRGVWIASVFNLDYPSKADLTADELKAELDTILDTCEKNKLNTIFFQVRPACDALYESDIFPISTAISSYGNLVFDPLEYLVNEGHKRNIYIHAWVNPLRVTTYSMELDSLPENSPARKNPEFTVEYGDGKFYLNAALPEVHQLVSDGVREIVAKYDVDGIVFDDYFYPYPLYDKNGKVIDFDDNDEFKKYGKDFVDKADWRRDNINRLIELVYSTVHETDPECVFGVSPFAVWQNNDGKNGGSNTSNFEAYNSLYCDALAWIDGGYIDYISPQIYWAFDSATSGFDVVTRWWNAQLNGTNVKLYISHASYRYEDGEWADPSRELTEQIIFARSEESYRGSIFYGYDEINRNLRGASDDLLAAYNEEVIYTDIQSNGHGVSFTSPPSGSTTTEKNTFIIGMSDPYYSLNMNGIKVGTTKSGFFSVYVELEKGENKFTFTQNGINYEYIITYTTEKQTVSSEQKDPLLSSVSASSIYPSKNVSTSDSTLWASCIAPYGSTVTATVGGITTPLVLIAKPKATHSSSGYIGATYGANIKLPSADPNKITDAGKIIYSIKHKDGSSTAEGCSVRVLGEGAMLCVRAVNDYSELKITEWSSYYNDYTVQSKGMTDYAVSQNNGYYHLRMGGYISEDLVEEVTSSLPSISAEISSAIVENIGDATEIIFSTPDKLVYNGAIEDDRFVITLYNVNSVTAPVPTIGANPLFNGCLINRQGDRVSYAFPLKDINNFYGFDLYYKENAVVVCARNPITINSASATPLEGITIVLDAGHGGSDGGAPGVFVGAGFNINEKDINLSISKETEKHLTDLGATVFLTRSSDSDLALNDRTDMLEKLEPDLCISIHQNSMGYSSDITRIRGTLALWCMDSGRLLASEVGEKTAEALGRNSQGSRYQMLAMCKNPKFPACLIEVGFMTSIEEYELMISGAGVAKAAKGITDGIISYFERQADFLK